MSKVLIVIPARYASTRLPGKPLLNIAGVAMIKRVANVAAYVAAKLDNCTYVVATDDQRIADFCRAEHLPFVMTAQHCQSGTERCWDAVQKSEPKPAFIVNLQGDNPLCPPWFLERLILDWQQQQKTPIQQAPQASQVFTPFVHLSWQELDQLREQKKVTPFSGTTVQVDREGYALTFSKIILPAMRKEATLRAHLPKSPVRRHIGLYAYTYQALAQYFSLPAGQYEDPEGLEQMRFLEHGIPVKMVEVDYRGRTGMSGVDSPEDIARAEAILARDGEFVLS